NGRVGGQGLELLEPSPISDIDGCARRRDAALVHLADFLVAMAIFGGVSAAMFTVLQEGLRVYTIGVSRAESQQSGRIAVERLAGEIRTAGFGPRPAGFGELRGHRATPS